ALAAEARAEGRLANADHGLLADAVQRIAETDGRRRLALARGRRRDRRGEDRLAVRPALPPVDQAGRKLGLVVTVRLEIRRVDAELPFGELADALELGVTGYCNVVFHTCLTREKGSESFLSTGLPPSLLLALGVDVGLPFGAAAFGGRS